MKYNPRKKCLQIAPRDAELAYVALVDALRAIRETAGLPLDKYKRRGTLSPADHAQRFLLDAAGFLGIDMGAEWGHQLDLREEVE